MDSSTITPVVDSTTTLVVAFLAMLGVAIPPIVVALINRTGKATQPGSTPNVDLIAALDDDLDEVARDLARANRENERLERENARLNREAEAAAREVERLRDQLADARATNRGDQL